MERSPLGWIRRRRDSNQDANALDTFGWSRPSPVFHGSSARRFARIPASDNAAAHGCDQAARMGETMTDLNRRDLLAGAAAVGTAAALTPLATSSACATAAQAGAQAPGFYRYKVGEFEVSVVTDGA